MLPFKMTAQGTGGALSVCEVQLGGWESCHVLHMHTETGEAFFVLAGLLEAELGDDRLALEQGGFTLVPQSTPQTFANATSELAHVLALAMPGGIEELFAERNE